MVKQRAPKCIVYGQNFGYLIIVNGIYTLSFSHLKAQRFLIHSNGKLHCSYSQTFYYVTDKVNVIQPTQNDDNTSKL